MQRALLLLVASLAVAAPAHAIPMWVTVQIFEGFTSTQVGTGSFMFDSESFIADPNAAFGFSGLVSSLELGPHSGVDFYAGSLAGTHLDFSDVHLEWWDGYHAPTEGSERVFGGLNLPQWSWGWHSTAGGCAIAGMDGSTGFTVGDEFFMTSWWGGTGSPPDGGDPVVSISEPASFPLFLAGLFAAFSIGLVGRWCPRGDSNTRPTV